MRNESFLAQIRGVLPKFMESSSHSKKKDRCLDLKNFKCAHAHFFFSRERCADVMLDMLHIFELISVPPSQLAD